MDMMAGGLIPDLSVVIPFYNEEAGLGLLRDRLRGIDGWPPKFEIIFVNDGSKDGGPKIIVQWAEMDSRIKLLDLTRNFGHQAAICAGLDHANGRFVGIMDADLQDPPEFMAEMFQTASSEGWDVVFCARRSRKGFWLKRWAYRIFYALYARIAESPVDPDSGDFCVLSRRAVALLSTLPEKVRFVRGLRSWMGLRTKSISADRPERAAGQAQYSLAKLFGLALNGITSFSAMPLRLATLMGVLLCSGSLLLGVFYLVAWLVFDLHSSVPGFTTIVVLMLFLSGSQFLMMGIIGEYIAQIFWEVKHRPTYLVERSINLQRKADG